MQAEFEHYTSRPHCKEILSLFNNETW